MKHLITTFIALYLGLGNILAQGDLSVRNIPDSLMEGANAVLRFEDTRFEIHNIGKGTYTTRYAITILNPKAKNLSTITLGYDKLRSVRNINAAVYDAAGNLVKRLKKNEIRDYSDFDGISILSDNRVKQFSISHNKYPYSIEVSYQNTYDGLMFLPSWFAQTPRKTSVEQAKFTVFTPSEYQLRTETHGLSPAKVATNKGLTSHQWSLENVKPIEAEYNSSNPYSGYRVVKLAPTMFEIEGYRGRLDTWESFGQWNSLLSAGRDQLPPEKIEEIRKLVSNVTDRKEKIRLVYKYLQENTRYVSIQLGIGGWQPFSASYVAKKGFGDCKALTNYTKVMLKNLGIDAYYTLVNAGPNEEDVNPEFPSNQFNHAFLCVPNEQDTIWLECTSQTNPFGYLGNFTSDRNVLVLNEDGGKIVRTPAYLKDENLYQTTGEIRIDMEGNASGALTSNFSGLSFRYVDRFNMMDEEKKNSHLKRLFPVKGIDIKSFDFVEQRDELPEAQVTIEVSARKLASVSGKRIFLVPNQVNRSTFIPPKYKERESGFKVRYEENTVDSITYYVPEGIHPEHIPKNIKIDSEFGTYESRFEEGPGYIKYYRKMTTNRGSFSQSQYGKYVKFHEKCVKADKKKVVFLKST